MTSSLPSNEGWLVLGEVPGQLQAEIVRGLLEAQEIVVHLTQEGAGRALGLAVAPLGMVQILVRKKEYAAAEKIYADYLDGALEDTKFADDSGDSAP